jgi:tRNA/rRNA methyltransferase
MAETERVKSRAAAHLDPAAPTIILVRPQLGENIGTAARAMLNCGLGDLRLIKPRDGWPNVKALTAAAGAHEVLNRIQLFESVTDAVADLNLVYATTARSREMVKPVVTPRASIGTMRDAARRGERVGVLFGPEKAGLTNEELVLADALLQVPLNPAFSSLNLAQAVLILAYEWRVATSDAPPPDALPLGHTRMATKEEIVNFFEHLESALDARDFYSTPAMRPKMVRNMRSMFERISLTRQDVQTLYGIVKSLSEDGPQNNPRSPN